MADDVKNPNPNLIDEKDIPANWVPAAGSPSSPQGAAPPLPNEMPTFFSGSMAPALQHDKTFVGTEVASPRVPKFSLMPFGNQASPFTNAAAASTAAKTVAPVTPVTPGTPATDTEELCVNPQTGTSYTLQASDRGTLVSMSNAAGGTIQIPVPSGGTPITSAFGTPGFQGGAGASGLGNASPVPANAINIPAGALIVVCAIWSDSGTAGVTDDAGNSYTPASSAFKYANNFVQYFYVLSATAKMGAIVSAAFSNTANNYAGIGVWVVPLSGSVTFDVINLNGTTAATPSQTSGAITTTSTDEMVFAFNCDGGVGDSPPPANIPVSFSLGWVVDNTGYGALAAPFTSRNFFASAHRLFTSVQVGLKVTSTVGNHQGGGGLPVIAFKGAAVTPGAPGIGQCWYTYVENTGAGTFNLTLPTVGSFLLDGGTSPVAIGPNQGLILAFDGFNWYTMRGMGGGGGGVAAADIQNEAFTYATDTGAANAYVIAPTPAVAAYQAGQIFQFIAVHANTTASTLAVSGLAAKAITKNGTSALVSGDIVAGQLVTVIYDGTQFQMMNPPGTPGSGAVTSVFGRVGVVTAQTGDYTAAQVTNAESTANKDAASGYAGLTSATMLKLPEQATAVDARTTTSEAIADSDRAKIVTFSNGGAVAATIAQAGAGGNFLAGWYCDLINLGAGTVTLTPTTSTINGLSALVLKKGQGIRLVSDGANYAFVAGQPTTDSPNDADVLTFVAADSRWEAKPISALGGANASQLRGNNISSATPIGTQILQWNTADSAYDLVYNDYQPYATLWSEDFTTNRASAGGALASPFAGTSTAWTLAPTGGTAIAAYSYNQLPSHMGVVQLQLPAATANIVGALMPSMNGVNINGSETACTTLALLDNPGWRATYIFQFSKTWGQGNLTTSIAFSKAHTALYIGFANGHNSTYTTGSNFPPFFGLRPNIFLGLRYDTDTGVTMNVTAVAAGTGVYTVNGGNATANFYAGSYITFANCGNAANNGTFMVTASTSTSLTTTNTSSVLGSGLTGTAVQPSLNDTTFKFEYVTNPFPFIGQQTTVWRNNNSGTVTFTGGTYAAGTVVDSTITPTEGTWYRLDFECAAAGVVKLTLSGGGSTATTTITCGTVSFGDGTHNWTWAQGNNAVTATPGAGASFFNLLANGTNIQANVFGPGSIIAATSPPTGLTTPFTMVASNTSNAVTALQAGVLSGTLTQPSKLSGYPALWPMIIFGNDQSGSSPTDSGRTIGIDFFGMYYDPAIAAVTYDATKSRFFAGT